jgi:hypothetical protein
MAADVTGGFMPDNSALEPATQAVAGLKNGTSARATSLKD